MLYGYRMLHDDLLGQGKECCRNRVAGLANLAGINAQIGYKRRSGSLGGKPLLVVNNTLNRQFEVEAPARVWVTDITFIRTPEVSPISPSSLISTPAASSAGRCNAAKRGMLSCKQCTWPISEGN